eukprot:scaffold9829_cov26-Tisochrysis_lutea.AAC.4
MDICVDACSGSHSAIRRASMSTAGSCTMSASIPAAASARTSDSASCSSSSKRSTLTVQKPLTPCEWRKPISSGSSSMPKFSARARALKDSLTPK